MIGIKGLPRNLAQVRALLHAHLEEHRHLPESTRLRDLGSEKAVVQDYSGRVVFELLQNALDRATGHILLRWDRQRQILEVANDGRAITTQSVDGRRSDIQALLSMHSSSKSAGESIGNKGVGFRSVFGAGSQVEVWSRAEDGHWWGMHLQHPARFAVAVDGWISQDAASFYAPLMLSAQPELDSEHVTLIRLQDIRKPEVVASIEASMAELSRGPLAFLQERSALGLRITLSVAGEQDVTHVIDAKNYLAMAQRHMAFPVEVRASTGLDLDVADVRVIASNDPSNSRYWSYLPTEQPAGFGVQIHGDFYLSNSRRHLTLRKLEGTGQATDPAGWNATLVRLAAECIVELWQTPEVCLAETFWEYATPRACTCPHLKREVATLFWQARGAVFESMVKKSFSTGRTWPLVRYRQLFEALEAWADYAYRNLKLGYLSSHREYLLARIQASGAKVLPIVSEGLEENAPVLRAQPLVQIARGQHRGAEVDRIYYRRSGLENQTELAQVIMRQKSFITTFTPALDMSLAQQGLINFDRPEILAQLRPGDNEDDHVELVCAALALAGHEGTGGVGSFLRRAKERGVGAAWRFVSKETAASAGASLASLMVKGMDGHGHAAQACARVKGPWPQLDELWLAEVVDGIVPSSTIDDLCLLLGIGPIPLSDPETIALPDELPVETMTELVARWPLLSGFLAREEGRHLLAALERCRWLHSGGTVIIRDGLHGQGPYAPLDIWRQRSSGGFRTLLLPRLEVERGNDATWYAQLGIANALETNGAERVRRAFERLRHIDPRTLDSAALRDLRELYRSLMDLTLKHESLAPPVLYRVVGEAGRQQGLAWGCAGDRIWHDSGENPTALLSFNDIKLWVVRKLSKENACRYGLEHFEPKTAKISCHGDSNDPLAVKLRSQLHLAMPDLMAAASAAHNDFNASKALEVFARLIIRHYDDVWIEWSFDGKLGCLGKDSVGDVFEHVTQQGAHELWFDGPDVPLVECAHPLSQLLTEKRAFGALFKDGLHAWSNAADSVGKDGRVSGAVQRFRREYGISDQEVAEFRLRIDALVLTAEERLLWVASVREVLQSFASGLSCEPFPGMVIRPEIFLNARNVAEDEVTEALAGISKLRPLVDFAGTHASALALADTLPALAAAIEATPRERWIEALLEGLQKEVRVEHADESAQLKMMDFDPQVILHRRLDIEPQDQAPSTDALAFASGKLVLSALPEALDKLGLKSFSATRVSMIARDAPQDEDHFIRDARRKATGGLRAEEAVLDHCVPEAMRWLKEDPEGFHQALAAPLAFLGDEGQRRSTLITREEQMRSLLHVAEYVGNAGFDVLVPHDRRFLQVEVKRVAQLKSGRFFVSDNERRRALEYRQRDLGWRLWLVSSDGKSRDVTEVMDTFDKHSDALQTLANDGLRPGEWMFVLKE